MSSPSTLIRTVTFSQSAPGTQMSYGKWRQLGVPSSGDTKPQVSLCTSKLFGNTKRTTQSHLQRHGHNSTQTSVFRNSPGNSKQLFCTVNHLLKPQIPSLTETTEEHCNNFLAFFKSKVDSIHSSFPGSSTLPAPTVHSQPAISQTLQCFPEITGRVWKDNQKDETHHLCPRPISNSSSESKHFCPKPSDCHSLQSGNVPPALKTAIIRPILKKPTLDPDAFANYRPISNLPFLSKVLEKVVAAHLQDHLKHNLFKKFQSGFRSVHSPG